jgi:hypothetical protein
MPMWQWNWGKIPAFSRNVVLHLNLKISLIDLDRSTTFAAATNTIV